VSGEEYSILSFLMAADAIYGLACDSQVQEIMRGSLVWLACAWCYQEYKGCLTDYLQIACLVYMFITRKQAPTKYLSAASGVVFMNPFLLADGIFGQFLNFVVRLEGTLGRKKLLEFTSDDY